MVINITTGGGAGEYFPRDTYIVTNVHVALYRMRAVPKILGMDNFPEWAKVDGVYDSSILLSVFWERAHMDPPPWRGGDFV